jgi:fluoride ion exporter CrcB/FEX
MTPLVVAFTLLAGAVGAVIRLMVVEVFPSTVTRFVPVLIVNLVGSTLAGALIALPPSAITAVIVVGLAGSLTTFSTVTLQLIVPEPGRRFPWVLGVALAHGLGATAAAWGAFHFVRLLI